MNLKFLVLPVLLALFLPCRTSFSALPEAMWGSIEQAWRAHDAAGILAYAGSSVRIQINDREPGNYSREQAQAILQDYFSGIQTVSFAFRDKSQRVATGDHRWQRGGRAGAGTVTVISEQASGGWVLTEIYVRDG